MSQKTEQLICAAENSIPTSFTSYMEFDVKCKVDDGLKLLFISLSVTGASPRSAHQLLKSRIFGQHS